MLFIINFRKENVIIIFIKKMAVLGLTLSVLSSTVIPSISSVYVLADEVDSIE